ncbi:MAG: hypothetical protein JW910_21505 [Anaerolineae bacterium]|nr:hypothetical protein [Anaerolineae bacterium]
MTNRPDFPDVSFLPQAVYRRRGVWLFVLVLLVSASAACTPATPTPPPPELLVPKLLATVYITPTRVSTQAVPPTWTPTSTPTITPVVPTRTATPTPFVGVFMGGDAASLALPAEAARAVVEITLQPLIGGPAVVEVEPTIRPTDGYTQGVVPGLLSPYPQPTRVPGAEAACDITPLAGFLNAYNSDPSVHERLGCPTDTPGTHFMAEQAFEHGRMIWREMGEVYAIAAGGTGGGWQPYWRVLDQWQEGQPESDPAFSPPAGLIQPVRGFGLAWRNEAAIRDALGWATAAENGYNGTWQEFSGGLMLEAASGVYVLLSPDAAGQGQYAGPFAGDGSGGFTGGGGPGGGTTGGGDTGQAGGNTSGGGRSE